jgi:hypothetical protein
MCSLDFGVKTGSGTYPVRTEVKETGTPLPTAAANNGGYIAPPHHRAPDTQSRFGPNEKVNNP